MPPLLEGFLVELKREHDMTPHAIALNAATFQKLMKWYLQRYVDEDYHLKMNKVLQAFLNNDRRVNILGIIFRRADQLADDVLATVVVPANEIDELNCES